MRSVTKREVLEAADWCEAVADGRTAEMPRPVPGSSVQMLSWDMMQPDMLPPRSAAYALREGHVPVGWKVTE